MDTNKNHRLVIRKIIVVPLAIIIPFFVACFYYKYYSVAHSFFSVQCTFHTLTGLHCPGCGGQRALHYLLHGEFLKALRNNILFVTGLPVLIYMYWLVVETWGMKKCRNTNGFFYSTMFAKIVLIILLLFFVLRNIPFVPFIYLAPADSF
jgi:uncharacterized integral membrane protein